MYDLDALYRFAAFEPDARDAFARMARMAARVLAADEVVLAFGRPGHVLVRAFDAQGRPVAETPLPDADALVSIDEPRAVAGVGPTPSHAVVPLRSADDTLGVLAVTDADARAWTPHDVDLLAGFAEALVEELALRVKVFVAEEKQAYLASEKEVLQQVAAGEGLDAVAASLANYVEQQSAGSLCVVRLVANEEEPTHAAPTLPEHFLDAYLHIPEADLPGPPGGADLAVVADLTRRAHGARALIELATAHDLRAWWSAPVMVDGVVRGSIAVLRSTPGEPCPEDVQLLTVATTIARLAIERVRSERTLRRSEEYFRSLIEKAADLTLVLNGDGTIRYLSPRSERTFGHVAPGADRLADKVLVRDRDHVAAALRRLAASGGGELDFEFSVEEPSGTTRCFEATASDLSDNPAIRGMVLNVRDLTERKTAEDALRESEERYRLVSSSTSDIIWDWDPRCGQVLWTASLEAVLGYPPAAIEGHRVWWEARIHPEDRERARERIIGVLDGTATNYSDEYRFRRADGTYAVVVDQATIFRDDAGAATRVVGAVVDVTRRRELEAQLRHVQRMEAVGQLAGGIAHDFNNLLTAISGFARLLQDEVAPEGEAPEFIAEIVAATDRAASLTRQLLAFSRRQVLQPRSVDLNEAVDGIQVMLRRLIGEDIAIETRLEPGIAPVWADKGQIEQVVLNLVVNARDAMPRGGTLTISTASVEPEGSPGAFEDHDDPGPYVRLTVEDTGEGMPPEVLARIFEPFFTTKGLGSGTGLGLSTVYGIVKQSGGDVTVDSVLGRGSRFDVFLLRTSLEQQETPETRSQEPDIGGSQRILVIEDDEAVRDLTRRVLQRSGYQVRTVDHGREALALVGAGVFRPDLLLTDVVLPHMSGPDVAERVVRLVPTARTLYMSGYSDHSLDTAPDDIASLLQKPFTPEVLLRAVGNALKPSDEGGELEAALG